MRSEWRMQFHAPARKTMTLSWRRPGQLPDPLIRELRSPVGLSWREIAPLRPHLRERNGVAENGGERRRTAERRGEAFLGVMNDE